MKAVVADVRRYDWEGDHPLRRRWARTMLYELHVRDFTRHPSSGLPDREHGTYAGLVQKIPHLLDLGVTAVELMPVFQFDPRTRRRAWSTTGATRPWRSSRPTRPTRRPPTRWAPGRVPRHGEGAPPPRPQAHCVGAAMETLRDALLLAQLDHHQAIHGIT
jgi:hypothetical protein